MLRSVRAPHHQPVAATEGSAILYLPAGSRDRAAVRDRLARTGASVTLPAGLPEALQMLGTRRYGLVVIDLGERASIPAVRLLCSQFPAIPVVGIIDVTQTSIATDAIAAGVTDLLPWPFDERDMAVVIAAAHDAMPADPLGGRSDGADRIFEHSAAMRPVTDAMRAAAPRRTAVLISGEPGSGRQFLARTLHERDHEFVSRPFVIVDCASDDDADVERQLFGVTADRSAEPGPDAPAEPVMRGCAILAAQGGTLFLANVTEAPASVQARLARVLRDRQAFSLDAQETIVPDFRPIASAGPDVDAAVADGHLRRDLIERIAQVRIDVPPLRQRREDLPFLVACFLRQACEELRAGPKRFSRAALTLLTALPWTGNGAELRDVVTESVRNTHAPIIELEDVLRQASLDQAGSGHPTSGLTLREARMNFERDCISAMLMRYPGRVGDAAKALGIQRTNLYRKVRQLNVPRALLSARK